MAKHNDLKKQLWDVCTKSAGIFIKTVVKTVQDVMDAGSSVNASPKEGILGSKQNKCTRQQRLVEQFIRAKKQEDIKRSWLWDICLTKANVPIEDLLKNIQELIALGADLNAHDAEGKTLLHKVGDVKLYEDEAVFVRVFLTISKKIHRFPVKKKPKRSLSF